MVQVHPVQAVVKAACKAANITKAELSLKIGIGTTTLWRACTGKAIEPEQAKKLCAQFPELSYEALTLGTTNGDAATEAESTDPDDLDAFEGEDMQPRATAAGKPAEPNGHDPADGSPAPGSTAAHGTGAA